MVGNIAADFLTAEFVSVHLRTNDDEPREVWAGRIVDVQDYGLMVRVLSTSVNGHITSYCERSSHEVRFLPWHMVKYVTVREES